MKISVLRKSQLNTQCFFKLIWISLLLLTMNLQAQQSSLPCNQRTPWVPPTFNNLSVASSTIGLACWDNDIFLSLCNLPGSNLPANVGNASLTDMARGQIVVSGGLILSVTDNVNTYDAGNYVGFVISSGLINLGVLSSIQLRLYNDNVAVDTFNAFDLIGLDTDLFSGQFTIGFIADDDYDEVEIRFNDAIGLGFYDVHYVVMESFCTVDTLVCNEQTKMNSPAFPMTIDYANTGSTGVSLGEVSDPENAISASESDFAVLTSVVDVLGGVHIAVEEQVVDYPAGTFVGWDIENTNIVGLSLLDNITITTYLNGVETGSETGGGLLINGSALSSGRQIVGFVTDSEVDKIKLTISQPVNIGLGATLVYSAIFQEFCEGPDLPCNTDATLTTPDYPVHIEWAHTGFEGAACVLCEIIDQENVINSNSSDYAQIVLTAGLIVEGSLSVKKELSSYPANTFAGFHIENPVLVDADLLSGITVTTYLDGDEQESQTSTGALISASTNLLVNEGEQIVGFVTTLPFDEVRITLENLVELDLGTTLIYGVVIKSFCPTEVECDSTYYLVNDEFPVYVDAALTGIEGLACVACAVADAQNAITEDNDDYATITVVANVIGQASLAVRDALYVYPEGTFAGFVIENVGLALEVELLESITVSTYLNGVEQESVFGGDLIDLSVLILFISAESGRYNVGFVASLPFDEIRITAGSIASVINVIRVYSAFVDTRASSGGELNCCLANAGADVSMLCAGDMVMLTGTNPITGTWSEQMSNPGGATVSPTVDGEADAVFAEAATGVYRFVYTKVLGCTDTMSVTVMNCPPDAVQDDVMTDEDLPVVINVLGNDSAPENMTATPTIETQPSNGSVVVNGDGTITYTPDPDFYGNDNFSYEICDEGNPVLCDIATVNIEVGPVNDAPNAGDDTAMVDEDDSVIIHVNDNDGDVDSPLGIPVVVDPPANGMLTFNPIDSSFTYTPDPDFNGMDTFTYSICDDAMPPLCDTATVVIAVGAISDPIECNVKVPWVRNTYSVVVDHSTTGLACWEGDILCLGSDVPANVVNSDTGDFATGEILGVGSLTLSVTDTSTFYPAGYFAGYVISSGLLQLGLFDGITLTTYLDNVMQETYSAVDLIGLDAAFLSDPIEIGFVTEEDFDEIEIHFDNALGIGFYNVHYAIIENFCAGDTLLCNVETQMNAPAYPVTIDYANTGSDGISVGTISNPENAVSESTTDYASLNNVATILGSTFLTVEEQIVDYPAGTFVGFDIENLTVAGLGILSNITITSYLNDVQQEVASGPDLLAGVPLLNSSGRFTIGFVTTTSVDKVKISIDQPVGVTLGTTRVYSAIFRKFCAGGDLACNTQSAISMPEYPVLIDMQETGFTGGACVGCSIDDIGNVIDGSSTSYAEIDITVGALGIGSIAVKDQLTDYPATTFAGFRIENPSLADVDALTGITITTLLDGVEQESQTNTGALVTVSSGLLVGDDQQVVGFVTSAPFDEVKISLQNVGAVDVGTTRVYEMILGAFCPTVIECDSTYYLNGPEFPVYIDAFLSGLDGIACVACEVVDEENVITVDNDDYATITLAAVVGASASIAVADALYEYPAGTFAGFVIDNEGFLIEAELLESITISTYNNGVLQEFATGTDLIDLSVLILFISAESGRYNLGFEATLPFDEIRITASSLVTAINQILVYSAFVDTRGSDGGDLMCNNPPEAIPDYASTWGGVPVSIPVCDNDIDSDDPVIEPMVVDPPSFGTYMVQPDNTIVYEPDENFVGTDYFIYEICDSEPLCDTALVTILVLPMNDTITQTIPEDSTYMVCADELTVFPDAEGNLSICDPASNGEIILMDDCITYDPDAGFIGSDTFCLVVCHPEDPELCDTTIIIIEVEPVNDPPVANPDNAMTNEDVAVIIDVHDNDADPDDPLGTPTVTEQPYNGNTTVNGDNTITYTPDPNFVGQDTFVYEICDAAPLCDTALVIVMVNPVNDTIEETIPEDETFTVCADELTTFTEPATTITVCDQPTNGVVTVMDDCVMYDPNENFNGIDTFCVYVCHPTDPNLCDTTYVIITVTPVNDPPVANRDDATTNQNQSVDIDVLANDMDPDDALGAPTVVDQPEHGMVTVNGDNTITYTPDVNYVGQDTFIYQICDPGPLCDTALVVITVALVSPPMITCPVDMTVNCNASTDPGSTGNATATSTCPGDVTVTYSDESTQGMDPGNCSFYSYTITRTFVAEDACGLTSVCVQMITVEDDSSPVLTMGTLESCYPSVAEAEAAAIAATTAMDNCGASNTLTFEAETEAGPNCDSLITVTVTDVCGNSSSVTYEVLTSCQVILLKVFLEGAYSLTGDSLRANLNNSHALPGQISPSPFIFDTPAGHPYQSAPWNHTGNTGTAYGDGGLIPYPPDVVDWVLVSVRQNGIMPPNTIWTCAGWVHTDGTVTFPDDCPGPVIDIADDYYIVVQHRNHLGIMSPSFVDIMCNGRQLFWDFTTSDSYKPIFRVGQKMMEPNVWAMLAANGEQQTSIQAINSNDRTEWKFWQNYLGYNPGDFDMNVSTNSLDETLWKINQNRTSGVIFY